MRKPKKNEPGYLRQRNALKRENLQRAVAYIDKLEAENEALRGDPNTQIGQFIAQFRELYSQNSRLSVLAASLIKRLGNRVELTKEEMEAFKDQRINVRWELPEGAASVEEAASYVFTYDLVPAQGAQPIDIVPPPADTVIPTEQPDPEPQPPEPEQPKPEPEQPRPGREPEQPPAQPGPDQQPLVQSVEVGS
jgi:hypothetical protein